MGGEGLHAVDRRGDGRLRVADVVEPRRMDGRGCACNRARTRGLTVRIMGEVVVPYLNKGGDSDEKVQITFVSR